MARKGPKPRVGFPVASAGHSVAATGWKGAVALPGTVPAVSQRKMTLPPVINSARSFLALVTEGAPPSDEQLARSLDGLALAYHYRPEAPQRTKNRKCRTSHRSIQNLARGSLSLATMPQRIQLPCWTRRRSGPLADQAALSARHLHVGRRTRHRQNAPFGAPSLT